MPSDLSWSMSPRQEYFEFIDFIFLINLNTSRFLLQIVIIFFVILIFIYRGSCKANRAFKVVLKIISESISQNAGKFCVCYPEADVYKCSIKRFFRNFCKSHRETLLLEESQFDKVAGWQPVTLLERRPTKRPQNMLQKQPAEYSIKNCS